MAEVKGALLNAWMSFLKNRYGEQSVINAFNALDSEDRNLLASHFLTSSWYPFDALHSLRHLTRKLATPADHNLAVEIGRYMAKDIYLGVYRAQLANDPIKQVEKFTWVDELLFRDARKFETAVTGKASCLVRYHYLQQTRPTQAICASHAGFWIQMLELAGATNVKSSHRKCATNGSDCCEFSFEWRS